MLAFRAALLALCCIAGAAAQEAPVAQVMREAEFHRGGSLLPPAHAEEESRRAVAVLRAYAATGEEKYFQEALRRARHLASFDARATSLEDSLSVAWALALACQWLAPRLDAGARAELARALRARAAVLFDNAWPESVPALLVIARTPAAGEHRHQAGVWLLQLGRES